VGPDASVITRDEVEHAKPDPDLFLAAADRLGADIQSPIVVGNSPWDLLGARRAGTLGVGFLSGGYGQDELDVRKPTGSIRIPAIFWSTWMSSACAR
jgi:beta-phosphoglucomutase-like phosphatase (HAD superfamily)